MRISNKLDSYYDIQAVNIDSDTDKKKNRKSVDDSIEESISSKE